MPFSRRRSSLSSVWRILVIKLATSSDWVTLTNSSRLNSNTCPLGARTIRFIAIELLYNITYWTENVISVPQSYKEKRRKNSFSTFYTPSENPWKRVGKSRKNIGNLRNPFGTFLGFRTQTTYFTTTFLPLIILMPFSGFESR